jgi:hypothetical protein
MWETPINGMEICGEGYWGMPDASVDFCEDKYIESYWIGEYYNTLSSLLYICVGIPFLFTKIANIALYIIGIGVGSIMLHGTLRCYGQWVDEIFMILTLFKTLKYIRPSTSNVLLVISIYLYCSFSHLYFVFLIIFGILKMYFLYIIFKSDKIWLKLYISTFMIAFTCWALDQVACSVVQPLQLHAWWHVFTSVSIFFGMMELLTHK